jgi:putative ATPase
LLADSVGAEFIPLSAVLAGVADVRAVIATARERRETGKHATVLFIDEIHRFNKAQQDALLPHVEDGIVTLIGATTENAAFSVTTPLLSRLRVFKFEPLDPDELRAVVAAALTDARGLEGHVVLPVDVEAHLLDLAAGDARQALNLLEAASSLAATAEETDAAGRVVLSLADLEAAAQQRVMLYDRAGDQHYDTISAFIKSIRGNDPDAALYYLATMIVAGEDPRFIARRLIIVASEDIGNGDPRGLQVAVAAAQALEMIGLPEAQYPLAQATVFLATAPKSNRAGAAYFAARAVVEERGSLPVPLHLRNTPQVLRGQSVPAAYRYPHDYQGADVAQQYLPDALAGQRFFTPSEEGYEKQLGERMALRRARREAAPGGVRTPPRP